jgi:hypothetical protein
MKTTEIDELCKRPGTEGALWRLVKHWNPDGIGTWAAAEQMAGTPAMELGRCVSNLCATAIFGLGTQMDNPREAILGRNGMVPMFQAALQAKISRHVQSKSPGGVILPSADEVKRTL